MNTFPVVAALTGFMICLWLASLWIKNTSIVDMFWGMLFVGLAWGYVYTSPIATPRGFLIAFLVSLWGLRLSWHLAKRNGWQHEDHRYVAMRQRHGKHWPWLSLFVVFFLQGLIALIVALPIYSASNIAASWNIYDAIGLLLFIVGLLFEIIADHQLKVFKHDPQNRGLTMKTGLWRYSRHPNYFGDALLWWGLFLLGGAATGAWWNIISPILMTFLLMQVSGVPLTEQRMKKTRPDFSDYAACTSSFFPWFPKSQSKNEK